MARPTTSRGATRPRSAPVGGPGAPPPSPRRASERSGRGHGRVVRRGRVELHELDVWVGMPARSAMATPSPVDSGGLVVTAKNWPAPPVAISRGRPGPRGPFGAAGRQRQHAGATAALDEQVEREPAFVDVRSPPSTWPRRGRAPPRLPSRPRPRGPPGPGSDHPRVRDSNRPPGLPVEGGPERDEILDPIRAFVDQDPHRFDIAETGARRSVSARCRSVGSSSPPRAAATPPCAQRVAERESSPFVSTRRARATPPGRPAGAPPWARRRPPENQNVEGAVGAGSRLTPNRFPCASTRDSIPSVRPPVRRDRPVALVDVHDHRRVALELGLVVGRVGDDDPR